MTSDIASLHFSLYVLLFLQLRTRLHHRSALAVRRHATRYFTNHEATRHGRHCAHHVKPTDQTNQDDTQYYLFYLLP